jgi:hypothetical protein
MQFRGSTRKQQQESRDTWAGWLRTVGPRSKQARFARRFMEQMEARVGSPQPHVATVAAEVMAQVNATELNGRPLTPQQLREVLIVLTKCWRHGLSLRNWAVGQKHMEHGDG